MTLRFWKWLIVVLAAAAIVVALRHANDSAEDDPSIGRHLSPDALQFTDSPSARTARPRPAASAQAGARIRVAGTGCSAAGSPRRT